MARPLASATSSCSGRKLQELCPNIFLYFQKPNKCTGLFHRLILLNQQNSKGNKVHTYLYMGGGENFKAGLQPSWGWPSMRFSGVRPSLLTWRGFWLAVLTELATMTNWPQWRTVEHVPLLLVPLCLCINKLLVTCMICNYSVGIHFKCIFCDYHHEL